MSQISTRLPIRFRKSGWWPYLLLMVLSGPAVWAQSGIQLVPIRPFQPWMDSPVAPSPARVEALTLPFFDDFSTSSAQPDPKLWVASSGAYINNTLPVNQPTVNVATFDGLRANGAPYVLNSTGLSYGATDTLTSQPIDLSGYAVADSVYLSFYWQRKGFGELPDVEDSLRLQFQAANGTWQTVWKQAGGVFSNNFVQQFIRVTQPYFHASFQFRFQSFGQQTGAFDQWHIDYLYMNRGRSVFDRYIKDIACRQAVSPYLKRYTAMPLRQYLVNPAAETADSVTTDINNLFNNFNFTTYRFTVQDQVSGRLVQDVQQPLSALIPALSSQRKSQKPTSFIGTTGTRAVLRSKFDVLTADDQNPSIPTINLRRNDTISGVTVLDDYYAFDDGTAEVGAQINIRQSSVAIRFVLNKPDTLTGIRMCIVPAGRDQTGQAFSVGVYANNHGVPGQRLASKSVAVQYSNTRNGFMDYRFNTSVMVTDTFFVGYTQINSDSPLAVGLDKNSPFRKQTFSSLAGSAWVLDTTLQGALMIRPVIGRSASSTIITGVNDEPSAALLVYPNPTRGQLTWGNPALSHIDVIDLSGRLLQSIVTAPEYRSATLTESLPDGLYLLRLSDGKRTVVQKILLRK